MAETATSAKTTAAEARPARLSHISVPVRDRAEAERFFVNVLGGEVVFNKPTFTEVRVAGTVFGFSEQKGGWTAPDAEYPHYAFEVEGNRWSPSRRDSRRMA